MSPPEEGQTCHPKASQCHYPNIPSVTFPLPASPQLSLEPITRHKVLCHPLCLHEATTRTPPTLPAQPRDRLPTLCCLFFQDPGISNRLQLLLLHPRTPTRASHSSCLPNHSLTALKLSWSHQSYLVSLRKQFVPVPWTLPVPTRSQIILQVSWTENHKQIDASGHSGDSGTRLARGCPHTHFTAPTADPSAAQHQQENLLQHVQ